MNFHWEKNLSNTGIYFLLGKDDNEYTIYISEAENIIKRLKQHLSDNEYWNDCIVVISKDDLPNKAHVKYLEYNFYRLACDSGMVVPDGFVVFKDSLISNDTVKSISPSLNNLRDKLIKENIIEDYIFTSPSTASSVIFGSSSNGRIDWKTSSGRTLKEVEEDT